MISCGLQVGLATISAGVQRAGGSRAHPGSVLDEALEVKAASIEGGASGDAIGMGIYSCPLLKPCGLSSGLCACIPAL